MPPLKVSIKSGTVDQDELTVALVAASGPTDKAGQPTNGNPQQPQQGLPWSHQFAPRAAKAIGEAITAVAIKTGTVKADSLYKVVTGAVMGQLDSVLTNISEATHGLELRSRLLWWKEAMMSPSARVSYRNIDRDCLPALMAYDYQAVLPALTPASVMAFLTETVTTLLGKGAQDAITFGDLVEKTSALPEAAGLRAAISEMNFAEGRQPLISTIRAGNNSQTSLNDRTAFGAEHKVGLADFALLIFLEFQAMKAIAEIEPSNETGEGTAE